MTTRAEARAVGGSRFGDRVMALLELARWANVLAGGAYALLGAWLAAGLGGLASFAVLRAVLVTMCILAAGNAMNDYADVDADRIAKPARPIPSARVSRGDAWRFAWILGVLGLILSASLSALHLLGGVVALGASAAYSLRLKAVPLAGNVTVAVLAAGLLPYAALATGDVPPTVWAASTLTALYIIPHEILLSMEDETSDRAVGIASTASVLGQPRAMMLYRVFAVGFCAVALAMGVVMPLPAGHLLIVPSAILPTIVVLGLTRGEPSPERLRRAGRLAGLAWWASLVPLALLRS